MYFLAMKKKLIRQWDLTTSLPMLTNIITIKVNVLSIQRDLSTNQMSKHVTLAYAFETNQRVWQYKTRIFTVEMQRSTS